MAIKWATSSGNWSNDAIWNGGTKPVLGDDVYANNFNITIDQNINVRTIRNTSNASPSITQGGSFIVASGNRTITLDGDRASVSFTFSGIWAAVVNCLLISAPSGNTITINSPLGNPNTSVNSAIYVSGNATINFTGTISPPPAFTSLFVVQNTATNGTLNIIGNPVGCVTESPGILISAPGYTCNVTGNCIGGGAAGNGNPSAIRLAAAATLNITGNITASGSAGIGVECTAAGSTITVTGNLTAASVSAVNFNNNNNTITVNGNVTASSAAPGITNNNTSATITVNGTLTNVSGYMAVYSPKLRINSSGSQSWQLQTSGSDRTLYTANSVLGQPAVTDVRDGVVYASGSLTGTCKVPPAASVAFGVPVDNTTGTAILTRAQLISDVGAIVAAYTV